MDPRQLTSVPGRKSNSLPTDLSEVVRTFVELPFYLFLLVSRILRESPIVLECYHVIIDLSIHTIQRIVQDPTIRECIASTISEGMNRFVQQPNLDQLLLHMVTSLSKSQPDIARQQGQDFPIVVSSFVQGILQHAVNRKSPLKMNKHHVNNQTEAVDTTESLKSLPLPVRSPSPPIDDVKHNAELCGVEKHDEDHTSAIGNADVFRPKGSTDDIETMSHDLVVCSSSSFSSAMLVTAADPITQHLCSEGRKIDDTLATLLPLPEVDIHNNMLIQIDNLPRDWTSATMVNSSVPKNDFAFDATDRQQQETGVSQIPSTAVEEESGTTAPLKTPQGPSLLHFPFFGRPR